ncbi:hypothetical protein G6730_05145 [Polynucleobacter paneuropaeus]|nr:hypothetical protein [Polynucleobacter paneuropaeus]
MTSNHQIIIPMSGFGERFREAGFVVPKPLIEVDGRPIISYVIDLFPGEQDFIFICNQEHLDNPVYRMREIILKYCPTGRLVGIPPHRLGPIHAVCQIEELLDLTRPTIVNYCDFTCYWDWSHFKKLVSQSFCDGAIPAYKGFHPHSLGATNYAYIRENNGCVVDIQEKQPFTENRMEEYASSGTYYFANARIMVEAFRRTIDENLNVGGEFYVSLAYKTLLQQGKKILVYPLRHFMQWGTPGDLAEYCSWSQIFKKLLSNPVSNNLTFEDPRGSLVIPMAGLGKRFVDEGYLLPKPLIPVSGNPMAIQAAEDLPKSKYQSFILRKDMHGLADIETSIKNHFPNACITIISEVTEGQACSALIGLEALDQLGVCDVSPITFGACDNGALFNFAKYQELINNPEVDIIVWGARGHINAVRNAQMFGWIDSKNGLIKSISVKSPLNSPAIDPVVIGTFTFKNSNFAKQSIKALIARDGRINGEFYLDSCINDAIALGLRCHLFEVDSFISWGTPNDLKTYEYWQSCFHKWTSHPYRLELDSRVKASNIHSLKRSFDVNDYKT